MVNYEKEVCNYLRLPSIPKKEWDGKTNFQNGVAVIKTYTEQECYAVASFDNNRDEKPVIKKVFSMEQFKDVVKIFVVPSYMDVESVENMDLDEESKKRAKELANEAVEVESEETADDTFSKLPEWVFPEIQNKEQAIAWLASYRRSNNIKGRVPENEETVKSCLLSIYSQMGKGKS